MKFGATFCVDFEGRLLQKFDVLLKKFDAGQ